MADHPDIIALPSDSTRWVWIVILARAKRQPEPGAFRTEAQLCGLLDRFQRRKLAHLFDAGLLEHREDGAIAVHNWPLWQSDTTPDLTHAERQRRYRERHPIGSQTGRSRATSGQAEMSPTGQDRSDAEHDSPDVTAVSQPSRVTASDGDPSIEGSDTVTPPMGAAVTGTQEEGFDRRRDLAAIIREAPNDAMRHRYRRIFDKTYGHLYERSVA